MGGYADSLLILAFILASIGCGSNDPTTPTSPVSEPTGELVVSARTLGDALDVNGYTFVLGDASGVSLSSDGEVRITELTPGAHSFEVNGIASNCRLLKLSVSDVVLPTGPTSGSVNIVSGRVTRLEVQVFCLRPDPGRIFYTVFPPEVRVMNALGGDRQFLPLAAWSTSVRLGDGKIAYDWEGDIWIAAADGSEPFNVTRTPDFDESRPSWSPDGRSIAYEGRVPGTPSDLFVVDEEGGTATNLTPDTPDWGDGEPAWSPDGTRIVFRSHRTGEGNCCSGGDLWTIAPDGSQLAQLTVGGSLDTNARFSPDGGRLVFTRFMGQVSQGGTDFELFVMNSDGTGLRQLTSDSARTSEADWSPDGRWIVFASRPWGQNQPFDLFMMRPNGADRVQLTLGERAGLPFWVP